MQIGSRTVGYSMNGSTAWCNLAISVAMRLHTPGDWFELMGFTLGVTRTEVLVE